MSNKKIIIIAIFIVILLMSIGYSIFESELSLNATTDIICEWDVRITNIEVQKVSEGCDAGTPKYNRTTVSFDAKLEKPGDSVTYEVTIKNDGTIDAILNYVIFLEELDGSPAINYVTTELAHTLKVGEETKFLVIAEYISSTTEIPDKKTKTLTGFIEYAQQ